MHRLEICTQGPGSLSDLCTLNVQEHIEGLFIFGVHSIILGIKNPLQRVNGNAVNSVIFVDFANLRDNLHVNKLSSSAKEKFTLKSLQER